MMDPWFWSAAIESSKEQLAENGVLPTTQLPVGAAAVSSPTRLRGLEFMPLKAQAWERQQQKDEGDDDDQEGDGSECPGGVDIEKLTWMTEAQLWTQQLEPISSKLHCEVQNLLQERALSNLFCTRFWILYSLTFSTVSSSVELLHLNKRQCS